VVVVVASWVQAEMVQPENIVVEEYSESTMNEKFLDMDVGVKTSRC
jgi:hypothetical protein